MSLINRISAESKNKIEFTFVYFPESYNEIDYSIHSLMCNVFERENCAENLC